jgi:hypothetical protein
LAVHFTANVGANTALPQNAPIQLAFDRLLLPITVTRQTFPLSDMNGAFLTPFISYDPVSRVVSITPMPDNPFKMGQSYTLQIVSPTNPQDSSGLHAIDGATLDPDPSNAPRSITFPISAPAATPPAPPVVDFCGTIVPIFQRNCTSGSCHGLSPAPGMPPPPTGLVLFAPPSNTAAEVYMTAIGRPSVEASTGPVAQASAPTRIFPRDMPIIDANGDPGNSFLIYKMLMAEPAAADGGTPASAAAYSGVTPFPLTDGERETLASMVPGREMPFPSDPSASPYTPTGLALTVDQMESISFWIAEGAQVPAAGCP